MPKIERYMIERAQRERRRDTQWREERGEFKRRCARERHTR